MIAVKCPDCLEEWETYSKSVAHRTLISHNCDNRLKPGIRRHSTHSACDERLAKYGGNTVGCCCTGHKCRDLEPVRAKA